MFARRPRCIKAALMGAALFFWPTVTLAEEILLTIPQPPPGLYSQYFGKSMTSVGDQDGDGFEDFIVGMPSYYGSQSSKNGKLHFFSGGPDVGPAPEFSDAGPQWDAHLGWSVTALGDFNGDGHEDFAASHPGGSVPGVRLYWGGPNLDSTPDFEISHEEAYSYFGFKISGGQDLIGDSWPDLVVTAPLQPQPGDKTGIIMIYEGGPQADDLPDKILFPPVGIVDFGIDVHLTDDVTGDGRADLLVLCFEPDILLIYPGGTALSDQPEWSFPLPDAPQNSFLQHPEVIIPQVTTGDLDGDLQPEIVVGLPFNGPAGEVHVFQTGPELDGFPDLILEGRKAGDYFGRMINISGDYDGDGLDDLLVGARGADEDNLAGYLWVFSADDDGGLTRRLVMTDASTPGWDGHYVRRFGASAVSLGDIDDDGIDELLVGSLSPYGYVWVVDELFFDHDDDGIDDLQQSFEDCDQDGIPDTSQRILWPGEDCNGDLEIDACTIAADPSLDCDLNGRIDDCEIVDQPSQDCDGDGELDRCQIADEPSLDCDADGILDACQIAWYPSLDCNDDGLLDSCQWAADPSLDCDANEEFDACQIAQDPSLDLDQDGVLDQCQNLGRLSLYADPEYTTHRLNTDALGAVGPFYLVLNVSTEVEIVTQIELELIVPPEFFGVQVDINPELGLDQDPRPHGLALTSPGASPDADGNLLIARVWPIVAQPGLANLTIGLTDNDSFAGNDDFEVPTYSEFEGEVRQITILEAGYFNGALVDVPPLDGSQRLEITNHPNPFNPRTVITMAFSQVGGARLEILDISGRLVCSFDLEVTAPGSQTMTWLGRDGQGRQVASGIYLARVIQGTQWAQKKLVLLR